MGETTQTPKANHPWRQYRNKRKDNVVENGETPISLKFFLQSIVENWDTYKIPPPDFEDREYISLCRITQAHQAQWIIGFIKKHWLNSSREDIFLDE